MGHIDEYLAKFGNQKLILIVAPISKAQPGSVTCGICGFAMNVAGECPRCKFELEARVREVVEEGEDRDVVDQAADRLDEQEPAAYLKVELIR